DATPGAVRGRGRCCVRRTPGRPRRCTDSSTPAANTAPPALRGQGDPMSSPAIERTIFCVAVAVVAAHVVDDTLVQPPSGTPATDHLVSAVVPVALLALVAWAYPRLSGFARGAVALALGPIAVATGVEAA